MMKSLEVRKLAVLGAGVMGAQIAAHCANAGIPVLLFDLPGSEAQPDGVVERALAQLRKLDPAPLASADAIEAITAANYLRDLPRLAECDLVIEAIAEKMEWKRELYAKVAPHLRADAVFASNTSGLSITTLAASMPEVVQPRFCGVHFFNPPRYLPLVELIPTAVTAPALLDQLETWLTTRLGKRVVRARDTPNFIANRVGVFAMLAAMHHTTRLGLGFDEVDALTGPLIGRPKSATFRTADVVGLDTLAHVLHTMQTQLAQDPWHAFFQQPAWLAQLIARGALGQKTRAGIYRKEGKQILVLDLQAGDYRASAAEVAPELLEILKRRHPAERFAGLRACTHPQAQFLWALFRDTLHYCAVHLADIADNARDVDLALRGGFGWSLGPFETWQAAGWRNLAEAIADDIAAGKAMSDTPLPGWVFERDGVHAAEGSYAPADGRMQPRSTLPVYARQLQAEPLIGEAPCDSGETLWENAGVRLWTLPQQDDGIAILSFTSKMHSIGDEVLDGVLEAVARAEDSHAGLVLWHPAPFAVGANLQQVAEACAAGQFDTLERTVAKFQQASLAIKHARVPVVAAVQGMALGGGCEFVMHAAHRVLALESYIGLVEAGVGLIPAGGGCKELALRAHRLAQQSANGDVFPFLQNAFQRVAQATVSKSALEAQAYGYAQPSDDVLLNADELLYVALRRARAMAEAGWHAPLPQHNIVVAGREGIANCELMLTNMREGGFISAHDYRVARAAATALCGGEVERGSRVSEDWLIELERAEFMALLKTPETQQRIVHMLKTGKPLRN